MSEQNEVKRNDEIDIFEFSSRMWKSFKSFLIGIKNFFISIIIFLIRKSLWIASFALIGMVIGISFDIIRKPSYTSMLEGNSGGVDNTVVIDHVNRLFQMRGKSEVLARTLAISVDDAEKVHYIRAFYGIDVNRDGIPDFIDERETYNPRRDTMFYRVPSVFYIKVALYDEDVLPHLRERILRYINGNNFIQTLFRIDTLQKREMIREITREIAKIDTIHLIDINRRSSVEMGQNVILTAPQPDIRLFHGEILSLIAQRQNLERSLEISDRPVVIVQDFIPAEFEERTATFYIFVLGFLMAFLGLVCGTLWQYRKTIWKIIMEEK